MREKSPSLQLGFCPALLVVILLAGSLLGQTNRQSFHNGVDYFFKSSVLPPTNVSTLARSFGSATSIGNASGGTEVSVHPIGIQQDGFEAWTAQATLTPSLTLPIGFSMLEFRRGGTFQGGTGTLVASTSWMTSLPCGAPWTWIVTFAWGTTFTQTATTAGAKQNFVFRLRGETNQALSNQNYFLGSGDERNLNSGGLSFFEDTSANVAFQVAGNQEWSHGYFQVDALSEVNRDPSGVGGPRGFDSATVGTGGTHLRSSSTVINPGNPADRVSFFVQACQQNTGTSNSTILLLSARNLGGGLQADATGSMVLPADGRKTNLVTDPVLTTLGLNLSAALSTGGGLGGLTGDIGLSGVAQTLALDLSAVSVPTPLQPLAVNTQLIGVQLPSFSVISNADRFDID
ncbi:MAG: hypothetical protein RL885_27375 [Planctomycetota bacterium]